MEELETIEIVNIKGEMVRINKGDFDEKIMKPFQDEAPKPAPKPKK